MVSQAIAQVARPVRCASLGTSRRNDSSSAEMRSGASARVSGTSPDAARSASRAMVSGCPRPSATRCGRAGGATPAWASSSRAFGRVERVEAVHGHELPPSGVGAPRRGGRVAAGQHDDGVGAQAGDELVAQPPVDRGELLVAVDEQDRAGQQLRDRLAVVVVVEGEPDGRVQPLR